MDIIGDPTVIQDIQAGAEDCGIFGTGGGRSGSFSAGFFHAASERDIRPQQFRVGGGTSVGAVNIAAFLTGQTRLSLKIHAELPRHFPWVSMDWLQLSLLAEALYGNLIEGIALDTDAIRRSRSALEVWISDLEGRGRFQNAKEVDDIVMLLIAAMSAQPFASCVPINGEMCVDGVHADPCPLVKLLLKHRVRRVLIIGNRPKPERLGWLETQWFPLVVDLLFRGKKYSPQLRENTRAMDEKLKQVLEMISRGRKRLKICAIFPSPEEAISPLTLRSSKIEVCGRRAYESTMRLLDEKRPGNEV